MTPTKMRRAAALVLAALCLTALCGCQLRLTLGDPFSWEDLSKTQEVQVIPGGTGDAVQTITGEAELEAFVAGLEVEQWQLTGLPEGAAVSGAFRLTQLESRKLGQRAEDRQRLEICTLLAYEGLPCLTVEAAGLQLHFQIPPEAQAHLAQYL